MFDVLSTGSLFLASGVSTEHQPCALHSLGCNGCSLCDDCVDCSSRAVVADMVCRGEFAAMGALGAVPA